MQLVLQSVLTLRLCGPALLAQRHEGEGSHAAAPHWQLWAPRAGEGAAGKAAAEARLSEGPPPVRVARSIAICRIELNGAAC